MDFEITDFIRIIKQRLLIIIIVMVISVLTTGLISFYILPPKYEARTTLLIQSQNGGDQISYNDLITNEKLATTYGEIIRSNKIAQDVIYRLKLNLTEKELLKKVKTEGIKGSLLTAITVTDSDPVLAVEIANSFAHSFRDNLPEIMKVENISILDEATIDSNLIQVSPKPFLNMTVALLLALSISIGTIILFEMLDRTVKSEEGIKQTFKLSVLGTIAKYSEKRKKDVIHYLNDPKSPISEAFRTLRTNIKYMDFKQEIRTLMVTSPVSHEGKTTIITNLAAAMAEEGKKILLMGCDLRKPTLHKLFNISNRRGLSNLLIKKIDTNKAIINTEINNLDILPSGPIPPNPSELLGSDAMLELMKELKNNYDMILIDSTPILPVTDGQILAKLSDAVLLVIQSGTTLIENVNKTKQLLDYVGAKIIGAVLNGKKIKTQTYYY